MQCAVVHTVKCKLLSYPVQHWLCCFANGDSIMPFFQVSAGGKRHGAVDSRLLGGQMRRGLGEIAGLPWLCEITQGYCSVLKASNAISFPPVGLLSVWRQRSQCVWHYFRPDGSKQQHEQPSSRGFFCLFYKCDLKFSLSFEIWWKNPKSKCSWGAAICTCYNTGFY